LRRGWKSGELIPQPSKRPTNKPCYYPLSRLVCRCPRTPLWGATSCRECTCRAAADLAPTGNPNRHHGRVPWDRSENPVLQRPYAQQHASCFAGVIAAHRAAKAKALAGVDHASSAGALSGWIKAKLHAQLATVSLLKGAPPEGCMGKPVSDGDAGPVVPQKSPCGWQHRLPAQRHCERVRWCLAPGRGSRRWHVSARHVCRCVQSFHPSCRLAFIPVFSTAMKQRLPSDGHADSALAKRWPCFR
jgi:hypothetical protein